MTPQEAYNIVATGLLRQGRKSRGGNGLCAYRSHDGCKCGIGFLIPDNEYNAKAIEGLRVLKIYSQIPSLSYFVENNKGADPNPLYFLLDLQAIHDTLSVKEWRQALTIFATRYNVSPSILETLP